MTAREAPPRRIAVLDVGKTNVKAVLVADGVEFSARTTPNIVRQDGPYPHFDIPRLQTFFLDALADLWRDGGFDAVSITAHGASGALLRGGDLAMPVLDYEHPGPDETAADYDRARPDFSESFSPRLPGGLNLGAQLFWQERCFPDAFVAATAIVTYPQYWAFWLTGVTATEATSLGTHTDLWAPRHKRFSSMVEALGWTPKMAPLRSAFDALGPIHPGLARRIGLDRPVPVACGIHDSNASLLPHLQTGDARFSVVSTGTWVVAFALGGSLEGLDPGRDMLANVDAYGRPVPSARFMGGREFARLTGPDPVAPDTAAVARVLEGRVMALPTFAPNTGPFPRRRGTWTHDPKDLPPEEVAAAATLYEALLTTACLERLGAEGPVIVEGPFARNALYCDVLEGLLGRSVLQAEGSTGTSVGATYLMWSGSRGPRFRERQRSSIPDATLLANYAARWTEAVRAMP